MERTLPPSNNIADQSNLFQDLTGNLVGFCICYLHRTYRPVSIIIFFSAISCVVLLSTMLGLSGPDNVSSSSASVTTYHNDNSRTGANVAETILTPSNVNPGQFGKLFSHAVDGGVYAQPLYLPKVRVAGKSVHNVIYVAKENDSVYAFDADSNAGANSFPLWHASFVNPAAGITPVSNLDVSCSDISPTIGITGTPVIDPGSGTLYVVAKTKENGSFVQRLHALDVTSGAEKFGGPMVISPSVPGSGTDAIGGWVRFNPLRQHQRPALMLSGGVIYIAWGSHGDNPPYHGWIVGFSASTLGQVLAFSNTPNDAAGGIWMAGALSADTSGNLFATSGNGSVNPNFA